MFVGPYAVPAPPHLFVREIQRRVESYYGLASGEMRSARRDRSIARPRQIGMYLSRRLAFRSLPEIGRLFGDRDHTTVLHAVRAIEGLRLSDPAVDRDVRALCLALTTPEPTSLR
jgi:chromosomal replication initiator protein